MRGYLSFVLVMVSLLLVFSLLDAREASLSTDLSKAISVERVYSLQMNVKECILEAARQGADEGFKAYDATHDIKKCIHCPDSFCSSNPRAKNRCDPGLCTQCFHEGEARGEAKKYAEARIGLLGIHDFDPDFTVTLWDAEVELLTQPDPTAKNGFSPDYTRFKKNLRISLVSDKLGISADARIPRGVVIYHEGAGNG
jgi:hypothetical protein